MNQLGNEKSPYLLQHKDNPVNWYAWGPEAFTAATEQEKPIFLSIGYSTCYWCHVMEGECFEDQAVADFLNDNFVNIKVDREERPDVDQIYMDAVVALTGQGGWPMSVFLAPDLKPFWGGTYFPKDQFLQILAALAEAWASEREKVLGQSAEITKVLTRKLEKTEEFDANEVLKLSFNELETHFDFHDGGFGPAPKFPPSQQIKFLLREYIQSENKHAMLMSVRTLDRMARGGIFDHLGGGFARYSVDAKWLVPHFEKMLYDNALLADVYTEAYELLKQEGNLEVASMFESVARETLDYVLRDMKGEGGGFYSAEDAGKVGAEGEFYVFKDDELKDLLSDDEYELAVKLFQVSSEGNFEHNSNILHLTEDTPWADRLSESGKALREKLFAARAKRTRPHLDDKVLTAWNGMMISALAKGAQAFGESRYLSASVEAASFIESNLLKDGRLLRRYRDGESSIDGFLDDYAFFIEALINLYEPILILSG